ncbi:MAG: hypothetical protein M1836_004040 [Candelina mexicana]|nr:MAG: hypothetical protein M1836_004040 [Candelina mexicana]
MAATKTGSGAASTNKDAVYTTYGGAAATQSAAPGSAAKGSAAAVAINLGCSAVAKLQGAVFISEDRFVMVPAA